MIVYFFLNIIIMIVLSYFSKSVPELFLISIVFLAYKKDVNSKYLMFFVLLGGYFSDVFYFANYPIYTLSYYIIYLIVFNYIREFVVFNFFNISIIVFGFIFVEKMVFILFSLSIGLKIIIDRGIFSIIFEILSTLLFLFIYYKFNNFMEGRKKSPVY